MDSDASLAPRKSSIPSVPSDPVAAREFLQSRVSTYTGVALAIWGVAFLSDQRSRRVVHLLLQAADALAEAHGVGLIHRDIKPANLLVANRARRPDHLTVVDFGLAKDVSDADPKLSGTQDITGTPLYMSPEAILDPTHLDGRSDVYALGAVAYFLLTGSAPFIGRTIVDLRRAHSQGARAAFDSQWARGSSRDRTAR